MKERPIPFSATMVRAILAGTKNQTRRIVAFPRKRESFVLEDHGNGWWPYESDDGESSVCDDGCEHPYTCPYGVPGDVLYVKEAWRTSGEYDQRKPSELPDDAPIEYIASVLFGDERLTGRYRHARFMMRWMSRITLEITDVRVERLQEISREDEIAEGTPEGMFYDALWSSINGASSWDANPWVWVVCFKRVP